MLSGPLARPHIAPPAALDAQILAGTLCARLCHDLAGSLGALTGTLEMAAEENDREALTLSVALAQELTARLRLLRAAWGTGSDLPALDSLQPGFPGAERLRLDTIHLTATDDRMRRLALSLMLAATQALPRGGVIRVSGTNQTLAMEIEGPRAAWPEVLRNSAISEASLLEACETPRAMAVALACLQARALGRAIVIHDDTHLTIA
jgi:histidine phosphotransferase ChpT